MKGVEVIVIKMFWLTTANGHSNTVAKKYIIKKNNNSKKPLFAIDHNVKVFWSGWKDYCSLKRDLKQIRFFIYGVMVKKMSKAKIITVSTRFDWLAFWGFSKWHSPGLCRLAKSSWVTLMKLFTQHLRWVNNFINMDGSHLELWGTELIPLLFSINPSTQAIFFVLFV